MNRRVWGKKWGHSFLKVGPSGPEKAWADNVDCK